MGEKMARNEELFQAVCRGDRVTVQSIFQDALNRNRDVNELLNESMIPAMREMGNRFSRNEIYVPEMLIAARAMQAGLTIIEPVLAKSNHKPLGKLQSGRLKVTCMTLGKTSHHYAERSRL
jgi:5-methyltetrahydrofolate--homocysteine methyltransferase